MGSNLRWVAIASMALNLLLLQAINEQTSELETLSEESLTYTSTIAELQAETEAARVELAVLSVLDSHRLRVTPEVRHEMAQTILEAAHRYDLEPELILAVIFTESSFDPAAESEVGALGLMQLMPATATQVAKELEMEWKGRQLLTDPETNILMGSFYLRKLLHRFDDLNVALAAYNVGPNRLRTIMTEEDRVPRLYARKVQELTAALREEFF
jgi:soluble lytic murein transglycosylase